MLPLACTKSSEQSLASSTTRNGTVRNRIRDAQQLGERPRGALPIAHLDDGVVELDSHHVQATRSCHRNQPVAKTQIHPASGTNVALARQTWQFGSDQLNEVIGSHDPSNAPDPVMIRYLIRQIRPNSGPGLRTTCQRSNVDHQRSAFSSSAPGMRS